MRYLITWQRRLAARFSMFIEKDVLRELASYQGSEVKSERSSGGTVEKSNLGTGLDSMMR